MKRIKFLGLIAATVLAFVSCGLLDEVQDAIDDIQDDQAPAYAESDGGLTITVSQKKNGFGSIHEAKFAPDSINDRADTICNFAQTKLTFFAEVLANAFLDSLSQDSALVAKWEIAKDKTNPKAITINQTRALSGMSKIVVAPLYKGIKKTYDEGGQIVDIMKKFGELK